MVGDCYDRYMVRVREMEQSLKIVAQAVDRLENDGARRRARQGPGEFQQDARRAKSISAPNRPRANWASTSSVDGKAKPYRLKCRAPSFTVLSVIPRIAPGLFIADMVALVGSLDVVLGEVDR